MVAAKESPKRKAQPSRYRVLRRDGSIETAHRTIEELMGLPPGSVRLVYPSGRKARSDANVGAFLRHWKRHGVEAR